MALISKYIGSWENHSYFRVEPKSNIWYLYKKRRKDRDTQTEGKATYRCIKFTVAVSKAEENLGPLVL